MPPPFPAQLKSFCKHFWRTSKCCSDVCTIQRRKDGYFIITSYSGLRWLISLVNVLWKINMNGQMTRSEVSRKIQWSPSWVIFQGIRSCVDLLQSQTVNKYFLLTFQQMLRNLLLPSCPWIPFCPYCQVIVVYKLFFPFFPTGKKPKHGNPFVRILLLRKEHYRKLILNKPKKQNF